MPLVLLPLLLVVLRSTPVASHPQACARSSYYLRSSRSLCVPSVLSALNCDCPIFVDFFFSVILFIYFYPQSGI